jgi:hypothetical protein
MPGRRDKRRKKQRKKVRREKYPVNKEGSGSGNGEDKTND